MSGYQGTGTLRRLRRRLLLGAGLALFAAGVAVLSIGLISYFDGEDAAEQGVGAEAPDYSDLIPPPPKSIDEVEGLPVAIPYNNPYPRVTAPLKMVIEKLSVDAPVIELGLDGQGVPQVPLNGKDVAWYNFSSKPGGGSNAVFAGHVNWERAPGVFAELDTLEAGDTVRLISDDGREYTYEVFANFPVDPEDPASLKVMAPTESDMITLITCGGTWVPDASERFGGNYTDRTIVQAKLVQSSLAAPVPSAISGG